MPFVPSPHFCSTFFLSILYFSLYILEEISASTKLTSDIYGPRKYQTIKIHENVAR